MNTREKFKSIRRAYRIAQKHPFLAPGGHLYEGACGIKIETLLALRKFTGRWDNCEPTRGLYMHTCETKRTRTNRTVIYAPIVWQACTRFLKTH